MKSAAYDMTQFEPSREERVREVRVIDNPSQKKVIRTYRARLAVISTTLLILMSLTVYNNMLLDLTKADIVKRTQEFNRLENEYSYLNCELENLISLKNASNYAENELGLVKISPSQVEYISLLNTNQIIEDESDEANENIFTRVYETCIRFFTQS